jgi:hypothetical protein
MPRIFNTIRQRMLQENRFSRYLIYAIGEIFLVVVGILIALQLNQLKEERNQRKAEIQTLEQLHDEFTSNLVQLDEKIYMRKVMMQAGVRLLAYHDDPALVVPDSVAILIAQTTVSPTFDPVTNDLITSGRLYLISNLALRRKLSTWTSELVQVTEEESAWILNYVLSYRPFLMSNSSMRNIQVATWSGLDLVQILMLDKQTYVNLDMSRSKRRMDLGAFLAHPELEDHLSMVISDNLFTNNQSDALRKSIVEILALIDTELKDH